MKKSLWLVLAAAALAAVGCFPQSGDFRTSDLSNMKQLSVSMDLYLSDSDDMFPFVQDPDDLRLLLYPYQRTYRLWTFGNTVHVFNPALAGFDSAKLDKPENVVMFYAAQPQKNGK